MLRVIGVVACCAGLVSCAQSPVPAETGPGRRAERPVALLFSGGGFIFDTGQLHEAGRIAHRLGFEPRLIDYPLYDLPGAVRAARRAARTARRDGREVYAFGESAGGTLAALLAQEGLVDGSATYCPVADLREFLRRNQDPALYQELIQASDAQLRLYSPMVHDAERPILAMRAVDDSPYFNRSIRRWDARDPWTRSVGVPGTHIDPDHRAVYEHNLRHGLDWLARSAGLDGGGD